MSKAQDILQKKIIEHGYFLAGAIQREDYGRAAFLQGYIDGLQFAINIIHATNQKARVTADSKGG